MTTKQFFRDQYGSVIDEFSPTRGVLATFSEDDGEFTMLRLSWQTAHGLDAHIVIYVEEDGFEIGLLVDHVPVTMGRKRSWETSPAKMLARLHELQSRAERSKGQR